MSKKSGKAVWRGRAQRATPGDWLKGLGLMLAVALLAWLGVLISDRQAAADDAEVAITRVMTSNPSACYSVDGQYYDWLELTNISDAAVNLRGWRLTDAGDIRGAFTFGDVPLAPGESKIVYCDTAPEGHAGDEIFTGFRLSSDGETLMLADPAQRIHLLEVPAMGKRDVFQRDPDTGRYTAVSFYESLGLDAAFTSTLTPPFDPDGVAISEVMPVNRATLQDQDGDYSDWIELHNPTDRAISLSGCALSDDDADRLRWRFPDMDLQPGEYRLVFCSGKDRRDPAGELHTSFRLSGKGEAVRLYNANADVLSWVKYEQAVADASFSRTDDGEITTKLDPSPGQPNDAQGAREATARTASNSLGLYINEVYTLGPGADWVEIINTGSNTVDLSGMGLSDNPAKPRKWQFPQGATLSAGGYALVKLAGAPDGSGETFPVDIKVKSGKGTDAETRIVQPDYTADFALSEAETLCLTMPEGEMLDRVKLYDQYRDISFGRVEGYDRFRYFSQPTPGAANAEKSYGKVAAEITFSTPPGLVSEKSIELAMTTTPGVDIYYTTDGTEPTPSSTRYSGPLTLDSNTCLRAVAAAEDTIPSEEAVASFIFSPHTVRLVAITGKPSRLNRSGGVLNTGVKGDGQTVYVEMYEPDGTKLIGQSCELKVVGHHTRVTYGQKAIKLTAKRATGDTRFRAKLFDNRDYDEVKAVVLRASGQDTEQSHMRDSVLTALAANTSVFYQETELCVVYVNGKYWGAYNMREHIDTHSIAQFEGWSNPDGVHISEGASGSAGYKKLLSWVKSHDMSKDSNVEELRTMMDIENYLDYVILEMYSCNQDLNNIRAYCSEEDPRWKWVLCDLDLSWQIDRNNVKEWFSEKVGSITSQSTTPFRYLMRNATLKDYFLTRFGELLATSLSADSVTGKFTARAELLQPEMAANCKRWNWSTSVWKKWVKRTLEYAAERPSKLVGYISDAFDLSSADRQKYFGAVPAATTG